jgi:arylsulfatase A-like enzyme
LTQRGQDTDWNAELTHGPNEAGFDYWFGMPNAHNQPPSVFIENHWVYQRDPKDPIRILSAEAAKDEGFASNAFGLSTGAKAAHQACPLDRLDMIMAERASEWISKQSKDKPFFLYVPFFAPHVPLAVAKEFQGTSPLAKSIGRPSNAGRMGDFVQQLDFAVGMVMKALKDHGFDDNTLVVFTSDNGNVNLGDCCNAGYRSNGDFLGQKADAWEGGHRVPFIARWPGHIPSERVSNRLLSLTDLYQTFLTAARVPLPPTAGPDSINQLPSLLDPAGTPPLRRAMLCKGKGAALRLGDWLYQPYQGAGGLFGEGWMAKLGFTNSDHTADGKLRPDAPLGQLYNLASDPSQTTNLYPKYPDLVAQIEAMRKEFEAGCRANKPIEAFLPMFDEPSRKLLWPPERWN